ncbi:glycerophosphodiester phosphodiesterase family protein [Flavihumibacter sp. CACIAM 22H1]|uniref:glycerophosphodiester phosphodiesterase n=1 Tax=Flavihumibacter sp. CACIAM 22H1 TaxID=1812911 RepID=UPI0007A89860|nr:glycerophosphodiester phosphodiesterase family protein [Flavihumibacter sp. CACIAM 22H1]KYP16301.1 MAG: hypothetical protein A1D16_20410 [Flavihumibacter sp. CACIAM 22H1]
MKVQLLTFLAIFCSLAVYSQPYRLIAHRGGVVDSLRPENSLPALETAIAQHYWMVEIDLRITADSVLITQHDRTFKRYFGLDSMVSSLPWSRIQQLRSPTGSRVLSFEEILRTCKGRIGVMIDNKIDGMDEALFTRVLKLLDKYGLRKEALMIGTDESTEFFRGKIKLSCTRKQLEENKLRPDWNPAHYYLFSADISREDLEWAEKEGILVVGVLNHRNPSAPDALEMARQRAQKLKEAGVRNFQLDAAFKSVL